MFEAAVTKFCKSVSEEGSLHTVPDLDSATFCRPLNIITKKRRKWFWQSAKYSTNPDISLHELLTDTSVLKLEESRRDLVTYNRTHTHSLKGDIGAKLKDVLDIELKGSDSVEVTANFGKVEKVEIDRYDFMNIMKSRKLDLENEFITQLRKNKQNVLCVVVGTAEVVDKGTVTATKTVQGSETILGGKGPVSGNEDTDVNDTTKGTFEIPPLTPLGYNICELKVYSNGDVDVLLDRNLHGGFIDKDCDETDAPQLEDATAEMLFHPFHEIEEKKGTKLRSCVSQVAAFPANVKTLLLLLKAAQKASEGAKVDTPSSYTSKLQSSKESWQSLLEFAGFQIQGDEVSFPTEFAAKYDSVRYLFECLIELDEDTLIALGPLSTEPASKLFMMVCAALNKEYLRKTDILPVVPGDNAAWKFANSLGFSYSEDKTEVVPPSGNWGELEGTKRVLYALYLEGQGCADEDKLCVIL